MDRIEFDQQLAAMLRQDVERERDRAKRQAEEGRKRIGELLTVLADAAPP